MIVRGNSKFSISVKETVRNRLYVTNTQTQHIDDLPNCVHCRLQKPALSITGVGIDKRGHVQGHNNDKWLKNQYLTHPITENRIKRIVGKTNNLI